MAHCKITLSAQERADSQGVAGKGTHVASKVINALILRNCDQAGGRADRPSTCDIAAMLCVSKLSVSVETRQVRRDSLQAKVNWQFTTKDERIKLKRLNSTTTSWHNTSLTFTGWTANPSMGQTMVHAWR